MQLSNHPSTTCERDHLFSHYILLDHKKKAREFQKNIYFCFIDYTKAFDCVDHTKLWKILKQMEIPGHLSCLLRNLYADQEATLELDMEKQTGSKLGNSTSRLYLVTLLI